MDSISLLVGPPPNTSKPMNQDDFDNRYNFVKVRKKRTNAEIVKHYLIGDNWLLYEAPNSWMQLLPVTTWITKYHVKEHLWRDVLGAFYLSILFLPQCLATGVVIDHVPVGILSVFIPQVVYALFGSAQHSSLGSLSLSSMMIYSSIVHSNSSLAPITFSVALVQVLQFLLPLEMLFSYISSATLSGFSIGLYLRVITRFLPQMIVIRGSDCKSSNGTSTIAPSTVTTSSAEMKRVLQCFNAVVPCLQSSNVLAVLITLIASILFVVFRARLTRAISSRIGFSIPHEFLIIVLSVVATKLLVATDHPSIDVVWPQFKFPAHPQWSTFIDAFAISMYSMTAHMQIAKSIAMEKMYKVHRKQELLCFSIVSFISSCFGLLPPSSSCGSSQLNIECSKFSLVANVLSLIPMSLIVYFGSPYLHLIPNCAIWVMIIMSFHGWYDDIRVIREICHSSVWDATMAVSSLLCVILIPNTCIAFVVVLLISMASVAARVQFPPIDAMAKLSDTNYGEETRYEGDCLDTPVRIIRLTGPLLSVNCERVRAELYRQAVIVKGLIGIGIGTRTASLRSQSAVVPKESVTARESFNLSANITIIQENDTLTTVPPSDGAPIVRFLILSFCGVNYIDRDMLTCLSQIYGDLNGENVRLLFCGVSADVRDAMDLLGFHNSVPRAAFFPNVHEALICARNTVLPFHMSVSMNGYRDVIALSCAASNSELSRGISPEAV